MHDVYYFNTNKRKGNMKMAGTPIYQEVYLKIKKLIREGEYEVGDFLPPESEMERMFQVSRTTVRKVMDMLSKEGYIEVKQGRGTRVIDYNSTQHLNGITSISETLKAKGMDVSIKSMYIDTVEATKRTAERLEIKEGDMVYRTQRVILADGTPIVIMENFIDMRICPGLDEKLPQINSLYEFMEAEYGIILEFAKDVISAKTADFIESQMLDCRVGAALLTLRRTTYSNGRPVSYDKSTLRADKYRFELQVTGRHKPI